MSTEGNTAPDRAAGPMRLPRTTGAFSGVVIIVLGIWGALIPFIGPWFHYSFGSNKAWHFTGYRIWLDLVPGVVAVVGGLLLLSSSRRVSGLLGGWLAVVAGAWFVVGQTVTLLWRKGGNPIGAPTGGHFRQALELLGYFYALGVVIAVPAAFAMGRYFSRPRIVEEPFVAAGAAAGEAEERSGGLFRRRRRVAE